MDATPYDTSTRLPRYCKNTDVVSVWFSKLLWPRTIWEVWVRNTYSHKSIGAMVFTVHPNWPLLSFGARTPNKHNRTRAQIKQHASNGPRFVRWKIEIKTHEGRGRSEAEKGRETERERTACILMAGLIFSLIWEMITKIICQICEHDLSLNHNIPGIPLMLSNFQISHPELANASDIGPRTKSRKSSRVEHVAGGFLVLGRQFLLANVRMKSGTSRLWNRLCCYVQLVTTTEAHTIILNEIKMSQMTAIPRVCSASYSFYWITFARYVSHEPRSFLRCYWCCLYRWSVVHAIPECVSFISRNALNNCVHKHYGHT